MEDALQSFKLLVSQTGSQKAWRPINTVGPIASSSSSAASSAGPQRSAGPSAGAAHPAGRVREQSRNSSVAALAGASSGVDAGLASSSKGKGRDDGMASIPSSPSQRKVTSNKQSSPSAESGTFKLLPYDPSAIKVHKRSGGKSVGLPAGVDVYRAVVDVPFEGTPDLEAFRSSLVVPEARSRWDTMVEEAETIEMLDPQTRIHRTKFKLGWPASPRDAITISRTMTDGSTLLDVSTSLPRSVDAPAYLKPAPPCVRSHVHLFACCVQVNEKDEAVTTSGPNTMRISIFWAWDLRGAWLGMPPGGLGWHVSSMAAGLAKWVRSGSDRLPSLATYGTSIEVLSSSYDVSRDTLTLSYCILAEEALSPTKNEAQATAQQTRRDMGCSIEFSLPSTEGWDVKVAVKAQILGEGSSMAWRPSAIGDSRRVSLKVKHDRLVGADESLRATITIQRIAASSDVRLRINDEPFAIAPADNDNVDVIEGPVAMGAPALATLDEAASLSGISISSSSSIDAAHSEASRHRPTESISQFSSSKRISTLAAIVRRNYIYFTSMLQEPEAKWRHLTDNRGVTVAQLDSIDPTLVVYRAEATFVGVGVWDIFAAISGPGTRAYWDRSLEETRLIEDVGNVSAVWHTKTRAAWPVSPRDSVMVETSYKSPSSVHIFAFSTDDRSLFPGIPSIPTGTIRSQVDLRGWSVEALSPTTVHVTLIEQSDPKGWTSKSATPAAMTAAVAGVGEHAIKVGAPPVLTRLLGAHMTDAKYDHEKSTFKLEYSRADSDDEGPLVAAGAHNIECELRCDLESWCANLDLVVDPPPINVSCLRRHRLSPGGGGLWLTVEHVTASLEDDSAKLTVRRGPVGKERGIVTVNGARIKVEVDELKDGQLAQLKEQKRSKPQRVPLDMKPAKQATESLAGSVDSFTAGSADVPSRVGSPAPLASVDSSGRSTAQQEPTAERKAKHPLSPALDVLFLLRRIYAERSPDPAVTPAGWALVSQRSGLFVRRKMMQSISSTIAVQRADKVVQGVTAEDMIAVVASLGCRKQWDERVESTKFLGSYGDGTTTSFLTTSGAFPFRGRGFLLSSLTAVASPSTADASGVSPSFTAQNVFYHAAASFPEEQSSFSSARLNPLALPVGRILIDGWIFETLDPYNSTLNWQIPSTRCTHISAIDYAGSLPATVNTLWNANLARSIVAVETFLKSRGSVPAVRGPPHCYRVLGDGRDEDTEFVWLLADESHKRRTSLLLSNFSPSEKRFEALLHVKPLIQGTAGVPGRREHTVSNASTTKGLAPSALDAQDPDDTVVGFPRSPSMTDRPLSSSLSTHRLLKASSANSLRSAAASSAATTPKRPSRTSQKAPEYAGTSERPPVLCDVEIELKHYAAGYKIEVFSQLAEQLDAEPTSKTEAQDDLKTPRAELSRQLETIKSVPEEKSPTAAPLSLSTIAKTKKEFSVEATVYELPPSAVLAATLDPSLRPRRHLLRLTLSSTQSKDGAASPDDESLGREQDLRERGGAVRVVIRPVRAESAAPPSTSDPKPSTPSGLDEIDPQHVPAYFGGQRLEIVHVNKTSAMLQREHDLDSAISQLKREPPSAKDGDLGIEDQVPAALVKPLAVATDMQQAAPVKESPAGSNANDGAEKAKEDQAAEQAGQATPTGEQSSKGEEPQATKSGSQQVDKEPASAASPTGVASATTSASSALISLLQSYPLARLGASTAVSTISATGEGLRQRGLGSSTQNDDASKGEEASEVGKKDGKGTDGTTAEAAAGQKVTTVAEGSPLHRARFSLATLLVVALICFLAGSLVRAMLSPADFILLPTAQADQSGQDANSVSAASVAASEIQRMLGGGSAGGMGSTSKTGAGAAVGWRQILRLVEIKRAIAGRYDLVVAVVDRR